MEPAYFKRYIINYAYYLFANLHHPRIWFNVFDEKFWMSNDIVLKIIDLASSSSTHSHLAE
jgi:hypothetical protein